MLGMTKRQIFFKITLLQVVKRVIPPMGNEFMTLIKDTALANIIATKEIIMMSKGIHQPRPDLAVVLHRPFLPRVLRRADAAVRLAGKENGLFPCIRASRNAYS